MNNTLTNGFKILEYLSSTAEPHSIKELVERFALPKSHVFRLLKTLKETGYVRQEFPSRKYTISIKILCLANSCLGKMVIRNRVRPFLDKLSRDVQQEVYLCVAYNWRALIVDAVYPNGHANNDSALTIGTLNPVHVSATGKLCAAYAPPEELGKLIPKNNRFAKATEKTITTIPRFMEELEKIRRDQIAVIESERGPGVNAMAAPIFNCEGKFVAAIGLILPMGDLSDTVWNYHKEKIKEAATAASFSLGYALSDLV